MGGVGRRGKGVKSPSLLLFLMLNGDPGRGGGGYSPAGERVRERCFASSVGGPKTSRVQLSVYSKI